MEEIKNIKIDMTGYKGDGQLFDIDLSNFDVKYVVKLRSKLFLIKFNSDRETVAFSKQQTIFLIKELVKKLKKHEIYKLIPDFFRINNEFEYQGKESEYIWFSKNRIDYLEENNLNRTNTLNRSDIIKELIRYIFLLEEMKLIEYNVGGINHGRQ